MKNPNDGRGVLIKLSPLGEEKTTSKQSVQRFNDVVQGEFTTMNFRYLFQNNTQNKRYDNRKSIFDTEKNKRAKYNQLHKQKRIV